MSPLSCRLGGEVIIRKSGLPSKKIRVMGRPHNSLILRICWRKLHLWGRSSRLLPFRWQNRIRALVWREQHMQATNDGWHACLRMSLSTAHAEASRPEPVAYLIVPNRSRNTRSYIYTYVYTYIYRERERALMTIPIFEEL